jgi:hypothetical protein
LRGDQPLALAVPDLDARAPPEQVLVPGVLADVGAASPGGLIAHLITDRVAEVLGDRELVGRAPRGRGGDLHRAVASVTDPGPLDGDLAEGGFEGEGSGTSTLDATTAFAPATLQDQLLVRLLD